MKSMEVSSPDDNSLKRRRRKKSEVARVTKEISGLKNVKKSRIPNNVNTIASSSATKTVKLLKKSELKKH